MQFPKPILAMIFIDFRMRILCRRIRDAIDEYHKFAPSDALKICARGSLPLFTKYLKQWPAINAKFTKAAGLNYNVEIINYLKLSGFNSSSVAYYFAKGGHCITIDKLTSSMLGACRGGHYEMFLKIIEIAGQKNYMFEFDLYFTEACRGGNINIIQYLMDINAYDLNDGLEGACRGGHSKIINLMIEKGAYDWNEGLHNACLGGHLWAVALMLSKGAYLLSYGLFGACRRGHYDVAMYLINRGANKSQDAFTLSCLGGNLDLVKELYKPYYNLTDALSKARTKNHQHIVEFLNSKGTDSNTLPSILPLCWDKPQQR